MATTRPRRLRPAARTRRPVRRTPESIRAAAARAVDRVLASEDAFALLIERLEHAGWRVERTPDAPLPSSR
jgi:hypothetical protein